MSVSEGGAGGKKEEMRWNTNTRMEWNTNTRMEWNTNTRSANTNNMMNRTQTLG